MQCEKTHAASDGWHDRLCIAFAAKFLCQIWLQHRLKKLDNGFVLNQTRTIVG